MLRLRHVNQNLFLPTLSIFKLKCFSLFLVLAASFTMNTLDAQTVLATRTASNTHHCINSNDYGAWLYFNNLDSYYAVSNASLVEYSDNTANYTGTITNNTNSNIVFHFNVTLSGRTFSTPTNSPKANDCGNNNTADWYYYTSTYGTFTGAQMANGASFTVERAGPSFQLGTGANQTEGSNIFGACGWLTVTINNQPYNSSLTLNNTTGDINVNLSGTALGTCDNVTYGGEIGGYEVSGGPFTATAITNVESPTGGSGALEFMWLQSNDPTLPWTQWTAINGADASTYSPGEITETTYFLRCSRRANCTYWDGESNVIAKIINGDGKTCDAGDAISENTGNVLYIDHNNGVDYADNIIGAIDGHAARLYDSGDYLIVELDDQLSAGDQLTISWKMRNYNTSYSGNSKLKVLESNDGNNFAVNTILETSLKTIYVHQTVTLINDSKYLKLIKESSIPDFDVDAISYNIRSCIPQEGSIGNMVWEDLNGNGIMDNGEPGIQGVFVFLEDDNGDAIPGIDFEVTNSEGKYLFENLPLDKYIVRFATPGGYLTTNAKEGNDNTVDSDASFLDGRSDIIDLNILQNNLTIDAGYVIPTQLTGIVWFDSNDNGIQDETIEGVGNVLVTLYDAGSDMIAGTTDDVKIGDNTTDPNGFYTFTNVIPGKYYVLVDETTLPLGYSFTDRNEGNNDFLDSDVNVNTGISDVFMIVSGENKSGEDAGVILTCGFIPSTTIGDARCLGFPVDFEALPNGVGFTYSWEFLDDITNPVLIGTASTRITDFTWFTSGVKVYNLTVTNPSGCDVYLSGTITVLPEEDAVCQQILPVEFISFTAELTGSDKVLLKWSTAWEENNNYFEVQRSTDGERYEAIGVVYGNGTTELINNYNFIDEAPFYGRNYYRLKQIDFNGTSDLSEVQSILLNSEALPDVMAYPNPTKGFTTLRVVTPFENDATIEIINSAGQVMEIVMMEAGSNSQQIDLTKYQPGFYFLNIKYNGFKKLVHRVLKVRD